MAYCCPTTCGRLATAAALISIGIVQAIAGMILLRSKYVYLLSVPNFWTASANIAVGSLFGVTATLWKTINKRTNKYSMRRKLLAALATSTVVLNGTTAGILIIGESNTLLSIHLENSGIYSSTTLASEILAYAYATSVCSPIVCIVVSIAFLTGICFRTKSVSRQSLNFKNFQMLREGNNHDYSWVYTPTPPKIDAEVLKNSFSSESELSSSESDSDDSSSIPIRLRSLASLHESNLSHSLTYSQKTLQSPIQKRNHPDSSVSSNCMKAGRVSFAGEFSSGKCRMFPSEANFIGKYSSDAKERNLASGKMKGVQSTKRKGRSGYMPKVLFTEYPPEEAIPDIRSSEATQNLISPYNKRKQVSHLVAQQLKKTKSIPLVHIVETENGVSNIRTLSDESPAMHEDSSVERVKQFSGCHSNVQRTSTAHDSKTQEEIASLDDSDIHLQSPLHSGEISRKDSQNTSMLEVKDILIDDKKANLSENASGEVNCSSTPVSVSVKDLNFRAKLASKLIPVSTPVLIEGHRYLISPSQTSQVTGIVKPCSNSTKTDSSYNNYLKTGFSSFKGGKDSTWNEIGASNFPRKHSSTVNKSPMDSITELPKEETRDIFLPSCSTHTSGYVSALEDDSDNESDAVLSSSHPKSSRFNNRQLTNKDSIENVQSVSGSSSRKIHLEPGTYSQSLKQRRIQSAIKQFVKENSHMSSEEIAQILLGSVV